MSMLEYCGECVHLNQSKDSLFCMLDRFLPEMVQKGFVCYSFEYPPDYVPDFFEPPENE